MLFPDYRKDRYCQFTYNPNLGEYERDWIRYADGTYEPLRREGDIGDKWKGDQNGHAWWQERKSAHWLPWEHGFGFAWNHTLGEEHKPEAWGGKSEAEHEAGQAPYFMELERGWNDRISYRTERIDGRREKWRFRYDPQGRLVGCLARNGWAQDYEYDDQGRRKADYVVGREPFMRVFKYDDIGRLALVDDTVYEHDEDGFRNARIGSEGATRYHYSWDGRLNRVDLPDGRAVEYQYDNKGRRVVRLINGDPVEAYHWSGDDRLAGFFDGQREWGFSHEGGASLPHGMEVNGVQFTMKYDQVGSLKAVVNENGNVVKALQYDPFGVLLWDSNPTLRIPLGFAGGLDDPETSLVRFGIRDYDPDTGRWTGSASTEKGRPQTVSLHDPVNIGNGLR